MKRNKSTLITMLSFFIRQVVFLSQYLNLLKAWLKVRGAPMPLIILCHSIRFGGKINVVMTHALAFRSRRLLNV